MDKTSQIKNTWENMLSWDEAIQTAKGKLKLIQNSKLDIARLAEKVCRPYTPGRTFNDFADALSISRRTLYSWIETYRHGVLPTNLKHKKEFTKEDFKKASLHRDIHRLSKKHDLKKHKTSKNLETAVAKINSINSLSKRGRTLLTSLNNMISLVTVNEISELDKGVHTELKIKCKQLLKLLEK